MPNEKGDAKHIRLFINGDGNYAGRRIVVNDRTVRSFEAFLDQATDVCKPAFGAVRNVYTPVGGTHITNLDTLQDGKDYVVGGKEKFRRLEYEQIHEPPKVGHAADHKKTAAFEASFVNRKKTVVRSARAVKEAKLAGHPIIVTVFRNGDALYHGVKLILTKRNLCDFDHVLTVITERIKLQSGFVRRLYTVEGRPVRDPSEIVNDGQYVACGFFDKFKRLPYSTATESPKSSPKGKKKALLMIEYSPQKGHQSDTGNESDASPPRKPIKVRRSKKAEGGATDDEDLSMGEPLIKKQARQAREDAAAEEGARKRAAIEAAEKKKKEDQEKRDREYDERERKIKEKKEKERKEKERAAELARQAAAKKKAMAEEERKKEEEDEEKLVAIVPDAPAVPDEKGLSRRTEKPIEMVAAEEIDDEDIEDLADGGEFNLGMSMDADDGDLAFESGDEKKKEEEEKAPSPTTSKAAHRTVESTKSRGSLGSMKSLKSSKSLKSVKDSAALRSSAPGSPKGVSSVRSSRASVKAPAAEEPSQEDAEESAADSHHAGDMDQTDGGDGDGEEEAEEAEEIADGDYGDDDGLPDESS